MRTSFSIGFALVLCLALGGVVPAQAPAKNDYRDGRNWLCRPGRQDACTVDLSTTVIAANGTFTREEWTANPNAPIDCFYVYPTVSLDLGGNSDMTAGPEELAVARTQFARFGSECRLFAPLYRQATLTALRAGMVGRIVPVDQKLVYNDVLDAWNDYLQHDNNGRGVVLIGHSQGSIVLTQLIRNEIDGRPVLSRVISALLPGTSIAVPKDADVGGAFQHIPVCRKAGQIGCVISYASFRAATPPPDTALFGRVPDRSMTAACVNPAALGGGDAVLHAYFPTGGRTLAGSATPQPWVTPPRPINTPFVSVPGLITAECVATIKASYLAVTVHGNPNDPRVDDITGDLVANGVINPNWGLHVVDVSLTLGDLISVVHGQAKAYVAAKRSP